VDLDAATLVDARRFIRLQLEQEIALQALGDDGVFRRSWRDDAVLERALELLNETDTTRELLTRPAA
jgi:hypothetical protein